MGVIGRLFTDDLVVLTLLVSVAIADIFLEFGRVMNVVVNRAIKACGDARYPLISIIIVEWIFILPLAYLLGDWLELGLLGIWIALALDEVVRGINLFIRWKSKRWQIKSKHLNQHIHASSN
jgi:Na+-driven multidrug efflux pump